MEDLRTDRAQPAKTTSGLPTSLIRWGAGMGVGMVMVTMAMSQPVPHQLSGDVDVAVGRAVLIVAFSALFGFYAAALARAPRRPGVPAELAVILGVAGVLCLLPALAPNSFSGDVHSYVMYGRVAAVHGENPMLVPPSAVGPDPYLALVEPHYRSTISVYGPVWNAMSAGLTWWAEALGGSPELYLALYRLACTAGFLISAALLWSLLGRLRPKAQLVGTIAFAWSPVLVVEASAVHNDTVMLAFVAAGLLGIAHGHRGLGFGLLALGALVKWVAIIPLMIVASHMLGRAHRRRDLADAAQTLATLALVPMIALVAAAAFGSPLRSLAAPFSSASAGSVNSFAEQLVILLPRIDFLGIDAAAAPMIVESAAKALILGVLLVALIAAWRSPDLGGALGVACAAMLATVLVAPRLWPWYLMWPLLLAGFAGRFVRLLSVLLGCSALLLYALYPVQGHLSLLTASRVVIVVIPAVALAWFLAAYAGQQPPTAAAAKRAAA